MADSYFIKRGEKSKGPFSLAQLQEFLKAQQVKSADMISVSAEGPWVRFASVSKEIKQGIAPPLPDPLWEVCDSEPGQEEKGVESDPAIVFGEYTESTPEAGTPATKPSDASRTRQCEDCGGVVSKRAAVCPHCGAPIVGDAGPQQVSPSADDPPAPMPVNVVTHHGKVVPCIHCKKEIAHNATKCPHCGGTFKTYIDLFELIFVTEKKIYIYFKKLRHGPDYDGDLDQDFLTFVKALPKNFFKMSVILIVILWLLILLLHLMNWVFG